MAGALRGGGTRGGGELPGPPAREAEADAALPYQHPEAVEGGEQKPTDPAPLALAARREIPEVPVGEDLSPAQKNDLDEVVMQHRDVFSNLPGRTTVTHHDIRTTP